MGDFPVPHLFPWLEMMAEATPPNGSRLENTRMNGISQQFIVQTVQQNKQGCKICFIYDAFQTKMVKEEEEEEVPTHIYIHIIQHTHNNTYNISNIYIYVT